MKNYKIREALQDLIIRLQDAEKGYQEIHNATSNVLLKNWMKKYARERHDFHKDLELESARIGGDPKVKTSFLGNLHRIFIDVKVNMIDDSLESIVDEIERGSNVLIRDYEKVLNEVSMPQNLKILLEAQQAKIKEEKNSLVHLRDEILAVC